MTKYVREGSAWKSVISGGYYVKDPTVLKQVDNAWVWDGVAWRKYYTKAVPVNITAKVDSWEKITLSWNSIAAGSTYVLKRGTTVIYSGPLLTYQDKLLMPAIEYTYTLEAYLSGKLLYTDTVKATTSAYADLGLNAVAASYSQINLTWSAANGSVDRFVLKRGTTQIYSDAGTSKSDTGLVANTTYNYTLTANRGTTVIKSDTDSAKTSARPTSSGSWNGPAATTSGGWTSCTARSLNGPTFPMPVNGYITSWNVLVWSYGSATGHFNPHIGGSYKGLRNCPGGRAYQHVNGDDLAMSAGNKSTGANTGGNCSYSTEWDAYSGVSWNYNVSIGTINYWWYTALARETLAAYPWWTEDLEDRSIHMETWGVGELTKVQITDKVTRSILVDWQADHHDESLYVD